MLSASASSMTTRRLFDLASELIEEILFHVDLHSDLISFACTCKLAASFIIPRHSEYRVLAFGDCKLALWAHLASRPELTRNIRKIMLAGAEYFKPRIPRDFRGPGVLVAGLTVEQETRYGQDMQKAFGYMNGLEELLVAASNAAMLERLYTPALLGAIVTRKPRLHTLAIRRGDNFHRLLEFDDVRETEYLTGLTHLHLSYASGSKGPLIPVCDWIRNSQQLVYLSLPSECLHDRLNFQFPVLQTLRIYRAHADDSSSAFPDFLKEHTTIENLSWFPSFEVLLRPGTLPRLKVLSGTMTVIRALERSYQHLVQDAATPPEKYRLECLSILRGTMETLLPLKSIEWTSIHFLDFHTNEETQRTLSTLARTCPNIHTLCFPTSWRTWPQDTLLTALSQFPNLRHLPTRAIWSFIDPDQPKQVSDLISKLGIFCPKLESLPFRQTTSTDRRFMKLIIVRQRSHNGIEVSYNLEPAKISHEFDPLHIFFHD